MKITVEKITLYVLTNFFNSSSVGIWKIKSLFDQVLLFYFNLERVITI